MRWHGSGQLITRLTVPSKADLHAVHRVFAGSVAFAAVAAAVGSEFAYVCRGQEVNPQHYDALSVGVHFQDGLAIVDKRAEQSSALAPGAAVPAAAAATATAASGADAAGAAV